MDLSPSEAAARCAVRPFFLTERKGVPGARNHAIRQARGDVIVFVDSDNFAAPTYLAAHLAIHEAHPKAVGRGPVILTRSIDRPFAVRAGILDLSTAYFDTDNASVRRTHLDRAGLFDEVFCFGAGDEDVGGDAEGEAVEFAFAGDVLDRFAFAAAFEEGRIADR